MTVDISSTANPHVRELSKLKTRRGRSAAGRFLIEGARELGRAIDAGAAVEEIMYCRSAASEAAGALASRVAVPITTVDEAPFSKLSVRQNPDGIIGVAATWEAGLNAIDRDLVVIAEAIEKPGNLGAILRSADGACAGVVAADPTVDLFNPNVVRASQGALFTVPVAVEKSAEVSRWASGRGSVVITAPDAELSLWQADLTGAVAIVIGSEHSGVAEVWRGVGTAVRIPMSGTADSLNASVTAGIALYEAVRQRTESSVDSHQSSARVRRPLKADD